MPACGKSRQNADFIRLNIFRSFLPAQNSSFLPYFLSKASKFSDFFLTVCQFFDYARCNYCEGIAKLWIFWHNFCFSVSSGHQADKFCKGKGKAMDIAIYVTALVVVGVAGIVCITRIIGGK